MEPKKAPDPDENEKIHDPVGQEKAPGSVGNAFPVDINPEAGIKTAKEMGGMVLSAVPFHKRFHPMTAGLLLFVDNLLFGANALSFGVFLPLICFLAFVFAGTGAFLIQKIKAGDGIGKSLGKGFLVGALAGFPTSVTGTVGSFYVLGMTAYKKYRVHEKEQNAS